jgi:hypothetical protein
MIVTLCHARPSLVVELAETYMYVSIANPTGKNKYYVNLFTTGMEWLPLRMQMSL